MPVHLERIYNLATKVTDLEKEYRFLENAVINLIASFAAVDKEKLPPVTDMRFSYGSTLRWSKSNVEEKVIGISEFEDNRLSFPQPLKLIGQPLAADLADIDGDGNIDCLYIAKDVNDIRSMNVIYNLNKAVKQQAQSAKKKWFAPGSRSLFVSMRSSKR